ncbi:MAG TPA: sugar transferase [Solirubrobacteraceae bacterium]
MLLYAATQLDQLRRLGIDGPKEQATALAVILAAVAGYHLRGRRALVNELVDPPPAPLAVTTPWELGAVRSSVAERYEDDGDRAPYVDRDTDDDLRTLLHEANFVVLVGASGAGKSRTAQQVAAELFPSCYVLKPRAASDGPGQPLRQLLQVRRLPFLWARRGCVLWLDDLGGYLDEGAIDAALLRRWLAAARGRRILATLNPADQERHVTAPGVLGQRARDIFQLAQEHELPLDWTRAEQTRARRVYRDVGNGVRQLARHLASGDRRIRRFRAAVESVPTGVALVRAAVDWRRAGQTRPVAKGWLLSVLGCYLTHDVDDDALEGALAWATHGLDAGTALLEEVPGDDVCFTVPDVIVEHVERTGPDISDGVWQSLLSGEVIDPAELLALATAASSRGEAEVATEAVSRVLEDQATDTGTRHAASVLWQQLAREQRRPQTRESLEVARERLLSPNGGRHGRGPSFKRPVRFLAWWFSHPVLIASARLTTLLAVDALGVWVGLVASALIAGGAEDVGAAAEWADERVAFVTLLVALLFLRAGLYLAERRRTSFARVAAALTQAAVFVSVVRILGGPEIPSHETIWITLAAAAPAIGLGRALQARGTRWFARQAMGRVPNIALLGAPERVAEVAQAMPEDSPRGRVVGYITTAEDAALDGLPCLGLLHERDRIVRERRIDELIVCDPELPDGDVAEIASFAWNRGIELHGLSGGRNFLVALSRYVPGEPLPLEELRLPVFDTGQRMAKRVFDLVAATVLLVMTAPLMLVAVVAIRASSRGPAILRHSQPGTGGFPFDLYKLRTTYMPRGPMREAPATPVGSVLRRFAVDELPQLFNVLRGDMSLVGPRPISASDYYALEDWQARRYLVRPGITGLWQISGRRDDRYDEVIRLDLYYVQKWSLFLDVEILVKTVAATLLGRRASLRVPDSRRSGDDD